MDTDSRRPQDDLGHPVHVPRPATRVVSLVPSLTESVAAAEQQVLVGATDWCTHPAELDVPRVRGTKNPNVRQIIDLQPDLVLANKEENRKHDVDALRAAGVSVWVTVIETVDQAIVSLRRLFTEALQQPIPGWLEEAARVWAQPAPVQRRSVVIPVWRDPWMVVGSSTFTGDLVSRLGLDNVYADHAERYPHVELADIADIVDISDTADTADTAEKRSDVVLLPDEPYPFSSTDGPEAFPGERVRLVSGRSLTWYGPSLTTARQTLIQQIQLATLDR